MSTTTFRLLQDLSFDTLKYRSGAIVRMHSDIEAQIVRMKIGVKLTHDPKAPEIDAETFAYAKVFRCGKHHHEWGTAPKAARKPGPTPQRVATATAVERRETTASTSAPVLSRDGFKRLAIMQDRLSRLNRNLQSK